MSQKTEVFELVDGLIEIAATHTDLARQQIALGSLVRTIGYPVSAHDHASSSLPALDQRLGLGEQGVGLVHLRLPVGTGRRLVDDGDEIPGGCWTRRLIWGRYAFLPFCLKLCVSIIIGQIPLGLVIDIAWRSGPLAFREPSTIK